MIVNNEGKFVSCEIDGEDVGLLEGFAHGEDEGMEDKKMVGGFVGEKRFMFGCPVTSLRGRGYLWRLIRFDLLPVAATYEQHQIEIKLFKHLFQRIILVQRMVLRMCHQFPDSAKC